MFTLDQVVPWGRSFDEYQRMFALHQDARRLKIIGCGDGRRISMRKLRDVVGMSYRAIRFTDTTLVRCKNGSLLLVPRFSTKPAKTSAFVWDVIRSVDHLGEVRMAA